MINSADAHPTPATRYFISHLPAILVIAIYNPIKSPKSTVIFKNSYRNKIIESNYEFGYNFFSDILQ
jgi:hypothetical protein